MAQVIGTSSRHPGSATASAGCSRRHGRHNLGDGLALAAGPLLVASQTHEPFLVALAALLQRLPWLLFGLYAGALADRVDRRRMVMVCDALRVVVLARPRARHRDRRRGHRASSSSRCS